MGGKFSLPSTFLYQILLFFNIRGFKPIRHYGSTNLDGPTVVGVRGARAKVRMNPPGLRTNIKTLVALRTAVRNWEIWPRHRGGELQPPE